MKNQLVWKMNQQMLQGSQPNFRQTNKSTVVNKQQKDNQFRHLRNTMVNSSWKMCLNLAEQPVENLRYQSLDKKYQSLDLTNDIVCTPSPKKKSNILFKNSQFNPNQFLKLTQTIGRGALNEEWALRTPKGVSPQNGSPLRSQTEQNYKKNYLINGSHCPALINSPIYVGNHEIAPGANKIGTSDSFDKGLISGRDSVYPIPNQNSQDKDLNSVPEIQNRSQFLQREISQLTTQSRLKQSQIKIFQKQGNEQIQQHPSQPSVFIQTKASQQDYKYLCATPLADGHNPIQSIPNSKNDQTAKKKILLQQQQHITRKNFEMDGSIKDDSEDMTLLHQSFIKKIRNKFPVSNSKLHPKTTKNTSKFTQISQKQNNQRNSIVAGASSSHAQDVFNSYKQYRMSIQSQIPPGTSNQSLSWQLNQQEQQFEIDLTEKNDLQLPPLQNSQTQINRDTPALMSPSVVDSMGHSSVALDHVSDCFRSTLTTKFGQQLKQNLKKQSNIEKSLKKRLVQKTYHDDKIMNVMNYLDYQIIQTMYTPKLEAIGEKLRSKMPQLPLESEDNKTPSYTKVMVHSPQIAFGNHTITYPTQINITSLSSAISSPAHSQPKLHISQSNNPFTNKRFFKNKKLIVMSSEEQLPLPNQKILSNSINKTVDWQPSESIVLQQTIKKNTEDEALDPNSAMSKSPTEYNSLVRQPLGQRNFKQILKIGNDQQTQQASQPIVTIDSPQKKSFESYLQKGGPGVGTGPGHNSNKLQSIDQRSDDLISILNSRLTNQDDQEIDKVTHNKETSQILSKLDNNNQFNEPESIQKYRNRKQTLALMQLDSPKFNDTIKMDDRPLFNPKESKSQLKETKPI